MQQGGGRSLLQCWSLLLQRSGGSQWSLSTLLAARWALAALPAVTSASRCAHSAAAAAAQPVPSSSDAGAGPTDSGADTVQQHAHEDQQRAAAAARRVPYDSSSSTSRSSSSNGSSSGAGSATSIKAMARLARSALRSSSAAASGGALEAVRPISDAALMALIRDANHLSDIERALLDHGPYFRWGLRWFWCLAFVGVLLRHTALGSMAATLWHSVLTVIGVL